MSDRYEEMKKRRAQLIKDNQLTNPNQEAAELEAKAKALRREDEAFWKQVDDRLDEIKKVYSLMTYQEAKTSEPDKSYLSSSGGYHGGAGGSTPAT